MPGEERIFGPHDYETYRQYRQRLRDDGSMTKSRAAALMATAMLMQGKSNQLVDRDQFHALSKKLRQQPAFRMMVRDPKYRALLREANGTGLINLMAEKETQRERSFDKYKRPDEYVKQDAQLLNSAIDSLKKKAPAEGAAAAGQAEITARGKLYQEMMKRLDEARTLADSGIQLSGEKTKELITAVKNYNDGGAKEQPGGKSPAEGQLEAMSILKQYMPGREFRSYCKEINEARGITDPSQDGYTSPEAFTPERLNGSAKTAKEWYAEAQKRLINSYSLESCAEVAAIRKLSGGNPHRAIRRDELETTAKELCAPGSALARTMKDEVSRREYLHLAIQGKTSDLGANLLKAAREHSAKAAQWQVNRSVRELTSGPVNAYVAADNLANILAARALVSRDDAAEPITNGAFRARAEQMKADPAFQQLARRYSEDPTFRRRMNETLIKSTKTLQKAYDQLSPPANGQQAVQPNDRQREPERAVEQPQPAPAP